MRNDTRSRIFNRHVADVGNCVLLVCIGGQLALAPLTAYADTGLPPPAVHQSTDNGFPSSQALKNQGYDPQRGVLRVDERNRGTPKVQKSGDTITGTQQKTATVTGKYGEKATIGTTAVQKTSISKLNTAANAAILASIAGQNQTQNANKLGSQVAQGDYAGAASTAVDMAGQVLDNLSGGILKGVADGYSGMADLRKAADNFHKQMYGNGGHTSANANSSGQSAQNGQQSAAQQAGQLSQIGKQAAAAQRQAEARGDLAGAVAQAAAAKAANAAAQAAQKNAAAATSGKELAEASRNKDGSYSQLYLRRIDIRSGSNINPKPNIEGFAWQIDRYNGIYNWHNAKTSSLKFKSLPDGYDDVSGAHYTPITSDAELAEARRKVAGMGGKEQQKTVEDMTLNDKDIKQILERMLENQNTNHQELMNQLAKMGNAVESATTSKEYTPSEAFSAPYTPQGSNTAQQTRFSIDKNGNVTATTVPRPDLKPNSSQAPTRTEVIPNKGQSQQGEQGQQQGTQQGQNQQTPTVPTTDHQQGQQTQQGESQETPNNTQTGQEQGQGQQTPTNPTTGQQIGGQPNQNQQQQQQDKQKKFCEENPKAAACAELGEADYEDISIPEKSIDLSFRPVEIFSTTGICPAPKQVDFGLFGTVEMSYDMICNLAAKLRPILVLVTMVSCMLIAYGAVKEL